jgi:hypothetical protein
MILELQKIAPKGDHQSQRMRERSSETDLESEDQNDSPAVLVDPYGLLARWQMNQGTRDSERS